MRFTSAIFVVPLTALALLGAGPCDDDDDMGDASSMTPDGGGSSDGGTIMDEDAGLDGAAVAPDAGSEGCDVTGPHIVYGNDIVQVSTDWKIGVLRGHVRAPDGVSGLRVVAQSRPVFGSHDLTFVSGTPGCSLCIVHPESIADGYAETTLVPDSPIAQAIGVPGVNGALVYGSNKLQMFDADGGGLWLPEGGMFSGMSEGVQYICGPPDGIDGEIAFEPLGNYGVDIYFTAECLLPTTSVYAYVHVVGSYDPDTGVFNHTYDVLASTEHSLIRYEVTRFDMHSRGSVFFPSGIAALHIDASVFVLDPTDFAELCDPASGIRTQITPFR